MSFQEDVKGKFKRQTSKQAIQLAMEGRWQESVAVNKGIVENFPHDVDAFNRLGKAYMELADYSKATEAYHQALQLDKFNTIAKTNLTRLSQVTEKTRSKKDHPAQQAQPYLFIEEIGRAGVVELSQVGTPETLRKVMPGDVIKLKVKDSSLIIEGPNKEFIGLVPAKQGKRLVKLMAGGNKYSSAIVSLSQNSVSVVIRETYQDPSQIDQVSFPGKRLEEVMPYTADQGFITEFEEEETPEVVAVEETPETHEDEPEEKDWDREA